jgi:pimeloyl-ACP methyl ester carboxylesterase
MLPSRGLKHAHVFVLSALSARGAAHHRDVPAISFQTMLYDLEAVVDALALERFALLGISAGAATSIAFAVRHPHRVSKLVLFGGYAQGRYKRDSPQDAEDGRAFLTMGRHGWGDDRLLFARAFLSFYLPTGTPEQLKSFIELQRVAIDGRTTAKLIQAVHAIDIVNLLPKVSVPTIVFHSIHDRLVPFDQGRRLALDPECRVCAARQREPRAACGRACLAEILGRNGGLSVGRELSGVANLIGYCRRPDAITPP